MTFIQAVLNGVLIGGVYALISTGLTLVFGVMEIVNFAQGEFLMIGMYVAYFAFVGLHVDPMVSAVFGFAAMFAIGILIEAGLVRRILRGPPISQVFLTVGLSVALQNLALGALRQRLPLGAGPVSNFGPRLLRAAVLGVVLARVRVGGGRQRRTVPVPLEDELRPLDARGVGQRRRGDAMRHPRQPRAALSRSASGRASRGSRAR